MTTSACLRALKNSDLTNSNRIKRRYVRILQIFRFKRCNALCARRFYSACDVTCLCFFIQFNVAYANWFNKCNEYVMYLGCIWRHSFKTETCLPFSLWLKVHDDKFPEMAASITHPINIKRELSAPKLLLHIIHINKDGKKIYKEFQSVNLRMGWPAVCFTMCNELAMGVAMLTSSTTGDSLIWVLYIGVEKKANNITKQNSKR